jgi:DNA-binding NarL/FixJ family response regulator
VFIRKAFQRRFRTPSEVVRPVSKTRVSLLKRNPKARIIFLTVHDVPLYREEAFALGALGYVLKQSVGKDLIPALLSVLSGLPHVSPGFGM